MPAARGCEYGAVSAQPLVASELSHGMQRVRYGNIEESESSTQIK